MAGRHLNAVPDDDAIPAEMQRVLEALEGVRPDGWHKWMALCPAHDDYPKASLSLRIGDVQPVLLNCFAGCTWKEIFAALNDLGAGASSAGWNGSGVKAVDRRRPADSVPSIGSVKGWHERLKADAEAKRYLHERGINDHTIKAHTIGWNGRSYTLPVFGERGSPVNLRTYDRSAEPKMRGLYGRASQLYPLDVLSEPDVEHVVVCEGEWDALLLNQHGIPAVTGTAGANTFKDEWAAQFKGKWAWIVFDCDDAGRKGAAVAGDALVQHADGVQVAELGLPENGDDVTDWFVKYGKTADDLLDVLNNAPEWKSSRPAKPRVKTTKAKAAQPERDGTEPKFEEAVARSAYGLRIQEAARQRHQRAKLEKEFVMPPALPTLADDLAVERPPLEFSIAELHVKGGNTILIAKYKTGKSTLFTNLLRSYADGVPFLGLYAVRKLDGRVALWNYELIAAQAIGWLRKAGIRHPDRAALWNLRGYRLPLTLPYVQEQAVAWLKSREVEVLLVDPFSRAYTGSENDNTELKQFTEALDVIKREAGVVDLSMAVHMGRERPEAGEERGRGATHLDDWPDVRWVLTRDGDKRYFYAEGRDVLVPEQGLAFDPQTKALTVVGGNRRDERDREHVRKVCDVVRDNPGIGLGDLRASEGLGKADRRSGYIKAAVEMELIELRKDGSRHAHFITEKGRAFVDHKASYVD